ncbi:hypothetical protein Ddc_17640 [Ditylenchus destructor]|nr:hypothetical protein Ddc_17640 [Ditylenchus destructor]
MSALLSITITILLVVFHLSSNLTSNVVKQNTSASNEPTVVEDVVDILHNISRRRAEIVLRKRNTPPARGRKTTPKRRKTTPKKTKTTKSAKKKNDEKAKRDRQKINRFTRKSALFGQWENQKRGPETRAPQFGTCVKKRCRRDNDCRQGKTTANCRRCNVVTKRCTFGKHAKGQPCNANRQCSGQFRCFTNPVKLLMEERGGLISKCWLPSKHEEPVFGVDLTDRLPWTEARVMAFRQEHNRFPKPFKYLDHNYMERHLEKFKKDPKGVSFLYPAKLYEEWERDVQKEWRTYLKPTHEEWRRADADEWRQGNMDMIWGLNNPEHDDTWKHQYTIKGLPQGDYKNPLGGVVVLPASEMDKVMNKHVHQSGHLIGIPKSREDFQKLRRIMGRTDRDSEITNGRDPNDPQGHRDAHYVRLDVSLKEAGRDDWITGLRMTDGNEQVYDGRQFKPGGYTREGGYPQATIGPFIPPPRVEKHKLYIKWPRPELPLPNEAP